MDGYIEDRERELGMMDLQLDIEGDDSKLDEPQELYGESICRVCLEKSPVDRAMYDIFKGKTDMTIKSMIASCASVQIFEGDGLPTSICHKCISNLNIAWHFKTQCEMSDAKLRHFYSSQAPLAPSIDEFSDSVKRQLEQEQNGDVSCCGEESDYTFLQLGNAALTTSFTEIRSSEETAKTNRRSRQRDGKRLAKPHQCDTCGKTFNRKEYLTQHIRIHTGEKPYCCHLCDKKFVNSGHLTTHMRKHTGEKPHSCNLCPKTFSTKQELQKHTMVHNGDRPFLCKMCGKRFGSSSNLYSHLKHHTGEKNFTCEQCGKAFYTKQELKQHSVVHTGEKNHSCDLCDKKFSQIAHLRRHSKLHKVDVVN